MEINKETIGQEILTILNKHRSEKGITWSSILDFTHDVRLFSNELFGERSIDIMPKYNQDTETVKMIIYINPDTTKYGNWYDYHFDIPYLTNE